MSDRININKITLRKGAHIRRNDGMCAMEAVAYAAGEPHSDAPPPACPVIAAFVRGLNDAIDDDERRTILLRHRIPKLVGSRSDKSTEHARSLLALDWLIRHWLPTWLDLRPDLHEHTAALRGLPPIDDGNATAAGVVVLAARAAAWAAAQDVADAGVVVRSAREAAGDAARDATGDAARDAAWYAAQDAAQDAAAYAARDTARSATWAAAWAAARDAAGDAARDAARSTLESTITQLQEDAAQLIDRMLAVGGGR